MSRPADYLRLLVPQRRAQWAIGMYAGKSPCSLAPHPALRGRPALSAAGLHGVKASGVADPFMVRHAGRWWMFFEIENRRRGKGEIGLASSVDALAWRFEQVVLREPFHLSYPYVLEHEGSYYMLPECAASGALRLYRARNFPDRWDFHAELLRGDFVDATPFQHAGKWWIIALEGFGRSDAMVIFHSDRLEGPWQPHALNPISSGNRRTARPAGRMIRYGGRLIRLAQDDEDQYGRSVSAFAIEELSAETYLERPLPDHGSILLGPSGRGWNATGMHHIDAVEQESEQWIACVDGRRTVWTWPVLDRLAARLRQNPA